MLPRSKSKCEFCGERPDTLFEKYVLYRVPFWAFVQLNKLYWLARKWHYWFHRDEDEILLERWVKALQPGDKVCTCFLTHETIESIDLKEGTVTTVEGRTHDLWHCIEPIDHAEEEHQLWLDK